jgi:O-antigen ligase
MQRLRQHTRRGVSEVPAWQSAPLVVMAMISVIALRLHELVPGIGIIRPGLLVAFGGISFLLLRSPSAARAAAFRHPLFKMVVAYWLFMLLTVPFALWAGLAFSTATFFIPGICLVLAILLCAPTRQNLRLLQATMVFGATAYALYARIWGSVLGEDRLEPGLGMYDSNDMAAILAMSFPLAIGLFLTERGRVRWAAAAAALILGMVVLASGSRGGLLALGAGALVLALGLKGWIRPAGLALMAVAVIGLWNFSPTFSARIDSIINVEGDYNLTDETGRKAVWARGRGYIRENPLVGVGAGNFGVREGLYFQQEYFGQRGGKWSAAHNAYVQAYADLGLIGGSIFVALLIWGVIATLGLWRGVRGMAGLVHRPEYLAALCAFIASSVFLSHAYYFPLLALLGIIAVARRGLLDGGDARLAAATRAPRRPLRSAAPPSMAAAQLWVRRDLPQQ